MSIANRIPSNFVAQVFRQRSLKALSVRLSILFVLLSAHTLAQVSQQVTSVDTPTDEKLEFNISSQRALTSLTIFASQAKKTLLFSPSLVQSVRTKRLKGRYTVPEAAKKLLMGTGLSLRLTDENQLILERIVNAESELQKYAAGYNPSARVEIDFETTIVTGYRNSFARSLDIKRDANQLVDSITAEFINKMPDVTVADSLQRVPGVQIGRSSGEGAKINVRGMPQIGTQLNGEQFLSALSITHIQPDFTDIPASLLAGVDVIKSPMASTLVSGISATLDLKTRRPLQLIDGLTFTGSLETTSGEYSKEQDPKFNLFYGYNVDNRVGAVFSLDYSKVNLANYRLGLASDANDQGWWEIASEAEAWDKDQNQQPRSYDINDNDIYDNRYISFQGHTALNRFTERTRAGVSSSFQIKLSPQFEFIADIFHTEMDEVDRTAGIVADNGWQNWGWWKPLNEIEYTRNDGNSIYAVQNYELEARRLLSYSRSTVQKSQSFNSNLELQYESGERFRGKIRFIHGEAKVELTNNIADSYINNGHSLGLTANYGFIGPTPLNPRGLQGRFAEYTVDPDSHYVIPLSIDYRDDHPVWDFSSIDGLTVLEGIEDLSIENYTLVSTYSEANHDVDADIHIIRADGSWEFTRLSGVLDFGVRVAERGIDRFEYDYAAPFPGGFTAEFDPRFENSETHIYAKWKDPTLRIDSDGIGGKTATDLSIATYLPFTRDTEAVYFGGQDVAGLDERGWVKELQDFGPATGLPETGIYIIDPKVMDDVLKFQNALYPGNVRVQVPTDSFKIDERQYTFYSQFGLLGDIQIGGFELLPFQANFGFKVVKTELDITQFFEGKNVSDDYGTPGPIIAISMTERSYTDILPSINIDVDVTNKQKIRFAYSETMTNNDANDLGLGIDVTRQPDPENSGKFVAVAGYARGNPNLEPWRSSNFDLSWEWYFDDMGMLSINPFLMQISSFQEEVFEQRRLRDSDGELSQDLLSTRVLRNGSGGRIRGIELGYQQAFNFLPGLLSGFGHIFNYTYSVSESGHRDFYGETLPVQDHSKHQMNYVLWYEKGGFQARIAYNYRSKRLIEPVTVIEKRFGQSQVEEKFGHWQDDTHFVDASLSYDISDNLTLLFEGTNLTSEFEDNYLQWKSQKTYQNIFERRLSVGARLTF